MCGFGTVDLLPGIFALRLHTAITLPVGVEAYGAYALGVWLTPSGVPAAARTWARWSAIGALSLGMLGQVAYHLLAAAHVTSAPWPVTVLVSCIPVCALGFAAALTHLLRTAPETQPQDAPQPHTMDTAPPAPVAAPESAPVRTRAPQRKTRSAPTPDAVAARFDGAVPSQRQVMREFRVSRPKAMELLASLGDRETAMVGAVNGTAASNGHGKVET